ncbi:hypothetical protein [Mucisphaera sp.]|uniref:hypothetical protein n=1 Tax=Mucisphaera sp. TaxID=2913024 RepID=UPI003D112C69
MRWPSIVSICLLTACLAGPASLATANTSPLSVVGERVRNSGLNDPVIHADATLTAQSATTWTRGTTRYILLDEQAGFAVGLYRFSAERALVRIETLTLDHQRVRRLTAYLLNATPHTSPNADQPPISGSSPRLTVTAATTAGLAVETDRMLRPDGPPEDPFVTEALAAIERHDIRRTTSTIDINPTPAVTTELLAARDRRRADIEQRKAEIQQATPQLAEGPSLGSLIDLPSTGRVTFASGRAVGRVGDDESTLTLVGGVTVVYVDPTGNLTLRLTAERAVVFAEGRLPLSGSISSEQITGVYLEDNAIVSDGVYTVRAPRVYVDARTQRALLFQAVAYTYDQDRGVPLYIRADEIRQVADAAAIAKNVRLTTSSFAEPHFAIGADELAIEVSRQPDGSATTRFAADDATLRVNDVPIFYSPTLSGRGQNIPLRSADAGFSSQNGLELETEWDLFALAGRDTPDGVDLTGRLDIQGQHGLALGAEIEYDRPNALGRAQTYLLPSDNGTDEIAGREDIDQNGDFRGFFHGQHLQQIAGGWTLAAQAAVVSDETFLEEFFPDQAYADLPFETSLYLANTDHDATFSFYLRRDINEFVETLPELQSPGFRLDELPTISYFRQATPLGRTGIVWASENSYSLQKIRYGTDTPADRGFSFNQSIDTFGILDTDSFDVIQDSFTLPEGFRHKLSTRQELSISRTYGIFDVTPYVAGRIVLYDDAAEFNLFGDQEPTERYWGAVGTRIQTSFTGTNNAITSDILDLNGIRHIIEPGVDLFVMETSYDTGEVWIIDDDTDRLAEGAGVRFGLLQTWQTRREALGRSRTVDWITLRTDAVIRSGESVTGDVIPRFWSHRPEYARGGDHLHGDLRWMVTEALGVAAEATQDLERDQTAQWKVGTTLEHSTRLTSFVNYQALHLLQSRLLGYGAEYQMTAKYRLDFEHRLDLDEGGSRDIALAINRQLPSWLVRLTAGYDEIEGETSLSVSLRPEPRQRRAGDGLLPYDNID